MQSGKLIQINLWLQQENAQFALDYSGRKLEAFFDRNNFNEEQRREFFLILLNRAAEVHFQVGTEDEYRQVLTGNVNDTLGQKLRIVKQVRPEIPIVLEIKAGVPVMLQAGMSYLIDRKPQIYSKAVDFIRKA